MNLLIILNRFYFECYNCYLNEKLGWFRIIGIKILCIYFKYMLLVVIYVVSF